jgi:hypothetical protein
MAGADQAKCDPDNFIRAILLGNGNGTFSVSAKNTAALAPSCEALCLPTSKFLCPKPEVFMLFP